jgi:hypothetical protein
MARPYKTGLDYFPHDVDASSDEKIESLVMLYGSLGYHFYFFLLERIYRSHNQELIVSDAETLQILARKLLITPEQFQKILDTALRLRCFDSKIYTEKGILTSDGIKKRAQITLEKREKMRIAYQKRVSAEKTPQETTPEMPQVKKSKVKKSKEYNNILPCDFKSDMEQLQDDIESPIPPIIKPTQIHTLKECQDAAFLNGLTDADAERYYNRYNASGWMNGTNSVVTDVRSHIAYLRSIGWFSHNMDTGGNGKKPKSNQPTMEEYQRNLAEMTRED